MSSKTNIIYFHQTTVLIPKKRNTEQKKNEVINLPDCFEEQYSLHCLAVLRFLIILKLSRRNNRDAKLTISININSALSTPAMISRYLIATVNNFTANIYYIFVIKLRFEIRTFDLIPY